MRRFLRNTVYISVVVSLLIHLFLWTGLRLADIPDFLKKNEKIEIIVLDQRPDEKSMQVVEQTTKPINDEIPEDAKYLSAHNQKVVKETKASVHGDFRNSAGQGSTPLQKPKMAAQKSQQKKSIVSGALPTLTDLKPNFDPSQLNKEVKAQGSGGAPSQTNDHIKDTPPSLETLLSTREFVYYSYYQRIRAQIRQFWEPSIREKVRQVFASGRSIASTKNHITRVIIILDKAGNLLTVKIVGESGVRDLDDAAVEAFRSAEPFPNPPKGIVEQDGTIRINWDFILEANLLKHEENPQRLAHLK